MASEVRTYGEKSPDTQLVGALHGCTELWHLLVGLFRTTANGIPIRAMSPSFYRTFDLFAFHWT
jgi:hypothetical protein